MAYGPQLPSIWIEHPEHVPEDRYEFQAGYTPMNLTAPISIEAGSDMNAVEALDRLRLGLHQIGLVPIQAEVHIEDVHEAYAEETEKTEPDEGDYIIQPDGTIAQYGKIVYTPDPDSDDEDADFRFIMEHCRQEQFWPDVWSLSDHGNLHLYEAEDFPRFEDADEYAQQ